MIGAGPGVAVHGMNGMKDEYQIINDRHTAEGQCFGNSILPADVGTLSNRPYVHCAEKKK